LDKIRGVGQNQAFGIDCASHIVDIGFAGLIKSRKFVLAKGVQDAGELVFGIVLQKFLVC
jgi:hypothetical protein